MKDSIKQKKYINQVGEKYAVLVKSMISKKKKNSVWTKTSGIFEHVICSSQATITSYECYSTKTIAANNLTKHLNLPSTI